MPQSNRRQGGQVLSLKVEQDGLPQISNRQVSSTLQLLLLKSHSEPKLCRHPTLFHKGLLPLLLPLLRLRYHLKDR